MASLKPSGGGLKGVARTASAVIAVVVWEILKAVTAGLGAYLQQ